MTPEEKPPLRTRFASAIDRALDVAFDMAAGNDWRSALIFTLLILLIVAGFAGLYVWLDLLDHWRGAK